ncbi:MAG: hypothetical protein PVH71_09555, partial [Chromatiales bacterium]
MWLKTLFMQVSHFGGGFFFPASKRFGMVIASPNGTVAGPKILSAHFPDKPRSQPDAEKHTQTIPDRRHACSRDGL